MKNFVLIAPNGYWLHMGESKVILTDCFPALVFDETANMEMERRLYSAICGADLRVEEVTA